MSNKEWICRVNHHRLMETTFMKTVSAVYEKDGDTESPIKFAKTLNAIYEGIQDPEAKSQFKDELQKLVETFPEHLAEMFCMTRIWSNLQPDQISIKSIIGEINKLILNLCDENEDQEWSPKVRKLRESVEY